jgi:PhoPQ-activated pathogenicity-related protein
MMRLLLTALACSITFAAEYTALDRYVAAKDGSYRYRLERTIPAAGAVIYQLEFTSQTWLTTAQVDKPEWRHWLTIVRPERVATSTAVLFIDGGSERSTPDTPNPVLLLAATQVGGVVVQLTQVPNQPLRFADETRTRTEDAIIAYTWDKYLQTGDDRWPARLPMTNSAVRAMDAATEFLATAPGGATEVKNFIVTGASKRGWTAWSTAAVDPRVIAVAPLVIDILNLQRSFEHHWRAYGFWAPAIRDYEAAGVLNSFGTPRITSLLEIEDPYEYRERLTLPKYLINSTGDQFFLPDSSQFYFDDLPGEKYLRYVPNTDHGLSGLEAPLNLLAWAQAVVTNHPRPRFYWRADREDGTLTLRVLDRPSRVLLWQATNPRARDFRLETIGAAWRSTPVTGENGVYRVAIDAPAQGYTAFFLELTYPGPGDLPLVFTTEVVVTPNFYPFASPPGVMFDSRPMRHTRR